MKRNFTVLAINVFALLLAMGCSQEPIQKAGTEEPQEIEKTDVAQLATVDGEIISLQEFSDHVKNLPSKMRRDIVSREGKLEALNNLLHEKILYREAMSQGFNENQKVLDELEKIKRGLILREFVQELLTADIPISDEEVNSYFNEHKREYDKPEKVRVSHIVTPDKGLAEQLLARIKQGEDFKVLAKKYSVDTRSNYKGGDLGYILPGRMPAEFDKKAFAMKRAGELSDIIEINKKYYIIKFNARIAAFKSSLTPSIMTNVKRKIKQTKQEDIIKNYTEELKGRYEVVINEEMLDSFVVPRASRHGGYMSTRDGGGH